MGEFDRIVAAMSESPVIVAFTEMSVSGDVSSLEKNGAKRQHFLPQLLLRRFASETDDRKRTFQMEATGRAAPRKVGLRGAASRNRLYAIEDEDGLLSNRHEGYLALIETHAAPALDHLLEEPAGLTPGERATIAFFIAVQTRRTPAAAAEITALAGSAFQNAATEMFSNRASFAARHRETFGTDADDAQIEEFRKEVIDSVREGKVRLVPGRGGAYAEGLAYAVGLVPAIFDFDWTLLRAAQGGFITSDRGYAIHDPTPPVPWAAQALLSSENSETIFPLGDEACLLLRPQPLGGRLSVREAGAEEVEAINLRIFGWAEDYVFGATQAGLVAVQAAARRRPDQVDRPRPFSQVILIETDPDDGSLVRDNLRRGWPARFANPEGEPRDYVVIPVDGSQGESRKLVDELVESRARKRAGVGPDDPLPGRIVGSAIYP